MRIKMPEKKMFLTRGDEKIAYMTQNGYSGAPTLVFLSGFRSDMTGSKAEALSAYAAHNNLSYLRFDYFGHGQSSGDLLQGTMSYWRSEVKDILDQLTKGPLILVGSSFGGWLSLMMALDIAPRIAGLVLIAPAVDMTDRLMWQEFSHSMRAELDDKGIIYTPSDYDDEGYPVTKALIEDGRQHLMLGKRIFYDGPVRILHGQQDSAVPWALSLELMAALSSKDVDVHFVKQGDHSLSNEENLRLLARTLDGLYASLS